jgi:hypothetical protein
MAACGLAAVFAAADSQVTDATAALSGDVSRPEPAPSVGLRRWLLGARPVVGMIAASSLMLLACSWFAIGTPGFGTSRDVGKPDPVRMEGSTPLTTATEQSPGVTQTGHRGDPQGRGSNRTEVTTAPNVRHPDEHAPQSATATGPAPGPAPARVGMQPPSVPAPAPETQGAQQPALPDVEITPPAPLDQVQTPSLPALPDSPVTPPALPLPQVSTGPVTVGVP